LTAKTIITFAVAVLLTACAGQQQINPQSSVDTNAKDDVIQLGVNTYQVLRKGVGADVTELKRSAGVAAASVCVPKGRSVRIDNQESSFNINFWGVITQSVLTTFTCI
jgi:hypothetical protein